MSRHLRRIERMDSGRERRDPWETISILPGAIVQRLRTPWLSLPQSPTITMRYRVGWTGLPIDEPATVTNLDADHAVANEREAIAAWHERQARAAQEHAHGLPLESNRHQLLAEDFAVHKTAARKIRNGDHHANTPPTAQKRG